MQIIPSILVSSEEEFLKQINGVQNILDQVQLDIADGEFVPNKIGVTPEVVEQNCNIDVELHLMVENPLLELQKWTAVENINRVLIHLESKNVAEAIKFAKDNDWQVSLVLNPETELISLEKYLTEIDSVTFMGVTPGKQRQELILETLEKIKEFTFHHPTMFTELDGGASEENLPKIIESGVKAICPGSAIFGNSLTPAENVTRLKEFINTLTKS